MRVGNPFAWISGFRLKAGMTVQGFRNDGGGFRNDAEEFPR